MFLEYTDYQLSENYLGSTKVVLDSEGGQLQELYLGSFIQKVFNFESEVIVSNTTEDFFELKNDAGEVFKIVELKDPEQQKSNTIFRRDNPLTHEVLQILKKGINPSSCVFYFITQDHIIGGSDVYVFFVAYGKDIIIEECKFFCDYSQVKGFQQSLSSSENEKISFNMEVMDRTFIRRIYNNFYKNTEQGRYWLEIRKTELVNFENDKFVKQLTRGFDFSVFEIYHLIISRRLIGKIFSIQCMLLIIIVLMIYSLFVK